MDTNAKGTFITNQEVFPYLKDAGGRIINFASGAGIRGLATAPIYAASKAAVIGWSRSVARAWGSYGITVNVVNPAVWTPMYQGYRERLSAEQLSAHDEEMKKRVLVGGKLGDIDSDVILPCCSC